MTRLLVVRHGHVEGMSPERFRGRRDVDLSDVGARQAEVMSTCQVPITVYRTVAKLNPIGAGAISVRACSSLQILAPDIARRAEVMTSQEATITISQ